MTREFDLAAALAAGTEDRATAWHFIRGDARERLAPLAEDDGWSGMELDTAERRLGVRFPAAFARDVWAARRAGRSDQQLQRD